LAPVYSPKGFAVTQYLFSDRFWPANDKDTFFRYQIIELAFRNRRPAAFAAYFCPTLLSSLLLYIAEAKLSIPISILSLLIF
jgi:hypothetical protein